MKRKIKALMAASMCLSLLAGCGNSGGNANDSDAGSETGSEAGTAAQITRADTGKIPISMWFWGSDEGQQKALQRVLIDKFNETHPEYELTVEYRSTVNKDMSVALAADQGPDIVYESSPSLAASYIQAGKYEDLTPYAEKYGWQERLIKPMYDSSTMNGKLYSIPMGLNVIGMVYNEKVLHDNGWEVPTAEEELVKIMDEAMAKGMYASVTGNAGWRETNEDYSSLFLNSFAKPEDVYKCLTNEEDWNSEPMIHALEKSAEYYQKGYLCSDYTSFGWAEAASLLATDGSPFFFGPMKFIQNLIGYAEGDLKDSFKFTAFPATQANNVPTYTIGATGLLAINANSEHKDVCAEFLDMLLSVDFVTEISQDWPGYWGVPLKDLSGIDADSYDGLTKTFLQGISEACAAIDSGHFGYYCSSYMPPETFREFVAIDTVWFNETTTGELLGKADRVFDKEFEKGVLPPVPAQR